MNRGGKTMESHELSRTTGSSLRPLTKRELDGMIADVASEVASSFADVAPIPLNYLGEEIFAIPMDTRRFIRVMSRYLNLN